MAKTRTSHASFDGKILKPDGGRCLWDVLDEFAGKVNGPKDWSENHDYYLYGVFELKKVQ